jgi:heat shock protein HslJ
MGVNMTRMLLIYGCLIAINALASCVGAQDELNGKWKLTSYKFSSDQGFPIEKMTVDVTISENKRIGGNSGCNLFGGEITFLERGKIKIGPLTSTERFCDETAGQFESLFTETLQNATEYSIKGGVLTFTAAKQKTSLSFGRSTADATPTPVEENHETFFIANKLVDCGQKTKCVQFKKEKSGIWYQMPQPIEDFHFRPGRFYKIEVKPTYGQRLGGARVLTYKLVRVIKTAVREKDLY